MTDHDLSDEGLRTRLTRDLPRYTAPPALRRSVMQAAAPPPPRPRWVTPLLSAAATALLILLAGVALLPPRTPADPVRRLVRAVVNEHTRAAMWGARHQEVLPAAIPWLTQESGIGLTRVFIGDERLQFVGAEPVYLERERGVALHYRDGDGHLVSYVALPARALTVPVPDRNRVQIDRFRPALLHDSGFAAWLWRQGDIACVIVSDMASVDQLDRFKDYFVRVRVATEPFQAF
jgi:anti-sigma factor RsiW